MAQDSQKSLNSDFTEGQILNAMHAMLLGKAQHLDLLALKLQAGTVSVNVIGMALALVTPTFVPLIAGFIGIVILGFWIKICQKNMIYRNIGEKARRAHLLIDSLNVSPDPDVASQLLPEAGLSMEEIRAFIQKNFFISKLPIGNNRLVENIWESAFFSKELHKKESQQYDRLSGGLLILLALAILLPWRVMLHSASISAMDQVANIVMAGGLVAILVELWLRARRHFHAFLDLVPIEVYLANLYLSPDIKESQLFYLLGDYNSTVESAPIISKSVYDKNRAHLNEQFALKKSVADARKQKSTSSGTNLGNSKQ